MEVWKDVNGFEGIYQVSNLGRVKSLPRKIARENDKGYFVGEKVLKQNFQTGGYLKVTLRKDGKHINKYVHRLVAEAFISNIEKFPQVNHKDEDKSNNIVSNLEWCDNTYNNTYGTKIKRQKESDYLQKIMKPIKGECISTGNVLFFDSVNSATKEGFVRRGIRDCLAGKNQQHHGYRWEYYKGGK